MERGLWAGGNTPAWLQTLVLPTTPWTSLFHRNLNLKNYGFIRLKIGNIELSTGLLHVGILTYKSGLLIKVRFFKNKKTRSLALTDLQCSFSTGRLIM